MLFDFFFIPPRYTFAVYDLQYILTFAGLLIVGLVISALAARARDQAEAARQRHVQTAALYDLSRDLAASDSLAAILDVLVDYMASTFGAKAAVLLPSGERLDIGKASLGFDCSDEELAVAEWSFRQGRAAGHGTETLPAARAIYFPLKTAQATVGVLGVSVSEPDHSLPPDQRRLLEASSALGALAIERAQLAEQAHRVQLVRETERLQTALLNSISHDLRTPLVSITGALSSLDEDIASLDHSSRRDLIHTALEQANRLNRLVGNLLDMTRLEADTVQVRREPTEMRELIGVALQEMGERVQGREVLVDIPPDMPLVPMDLVLMARVLVNVVDNALKYSEPDRPVEIGARVLAGRDGVSGSSHLEIQIRDRGVGIPEDSLERVFDKFYRIQRPESTVGTGLGLAISRGLVEAHGGRIWAQNREGSGVIVTIALPLVEEQAR